MRRLFLPRQPGGVALVLFVWTALLSHAASQADDVPHDPFRLTAGVDKIASQAMVETKTPGVSIGISHGGKTLLVKGYGNADVENNVPATAESVYRIGSITKQFTAAAIVQLVERGEVSLDAEVTEYLPDYPAGDRKITVRHLLHHTSGIKSYTSIPEFRKIMRNDLSHEEMLEVFQEKPFDFAPGEKYLYCNSGYYLLGLIIEQVSGQSYEDYLVEHVYEPAGLKHTYYDRTGRIIRHRAQGYDLSGGELANTRYLSMALPYAAGSLASTVVDLLAWQQALNDGKVVSRESLEQMTTAGTLNDGNEIDYGFGLALGQRSGQPMISHGGGINGFRSHLAYYPEIDLTVAVLTNLSVGRPNAIEKQIAELFLGTEEEPEQKPGTEEEEEEEERLDVLLRGGTIVDGSGQPRFRADVGVRDGRIVRVGPAGERTAELEIDASGMIVAPGFVDVHNHSENTIATKKRRFNEGFIRQGVTTIVGGPDGSLEPGRMRELIEAYEQNGVGTNVAFYVGHNAVRSRVMRNNPRRAPTADELDQMKSLVREGMELGALGLSTGLMYEPGMYSDTDEVAALAAVVAPYGGVYDSHVRNPVHELLESDREVIEIARRAAIGGKIGHLKAVGLQNEGLIRDVIALVEEARSAGLEIVSDQYPYDGAATSTLRTIVLVPPELRKGRAFDMKKSLADTERRAKIRETSENGIDGGFAWLKATGYSSMRITRSDDFPELVGEYLSELAEKRGVEPFDLVAQLLIEARRPIFITLGAIQEADVRELLVQPWNMVASDGAYADSASRGAGGHPRSTGTFPRVLGHYVRELELLSLEEAVRKMTSLPCEFLRLTGRGRIAEGLAADLVVFDPDSIRDRSTWSNPSAMAEGVLDVLVAGVPVLKDGKLTGESPGKFLRRP